MTPENAYDGLAAAMMALLGTLLAAVASLFVYRAVAPSGLRYYGVTMIAAFIVASAIIVWRSGLLRQSVEGGS